MFFILMNVMRIAVMIPYLIASRHCRPKYIQPKAQTYVQSIKRVKLPYIGYKRYQNAAPIQGWWVQGCRVVMELLLLSRCMTFINSTTSSTLATYRRLGRNSTRPQNKEACQSILVLHVKVVFLCLLYNAYHCHFQDTLVNQIHNYANEISFYNT